MKNTMKKFLALVLAGLMMVGCIAMLASCGKSKNKLIVYTEAGFPPFEFTEKGKTEIIGVDIEIAKYIADKYGYELDVIDGSFDTIVAGISEDNALGIAGISWKASRADAIEYSDFYYGGAFQAVVYLKSANPTMTEDEEFAASNFNGKTVVYQTGTTSQMTVAENETAWAIAEKKDYAEVMTALQEVKNGNGQKILVVDSDVAKQLVAANADCAYATIEGVEAESYGVVAKKGNTELIAKVNAAIAELLVKDANGKTQIDKWYEQFDAMEAED